MNKKITRAVFSDTSPQASLLFVELQVEKDSGKNFIINFDFENDKVNSTGTQMSLAAQLFSLLETFKDSARSDNDWPAKTRSVVHRDGNNTVIRCEEWYI